MNITTVSWIEADRMNQKVRMEQIRREQEEKRRVLMQMRRQTA